jgi:glycosyltransferase involved in cell wall biosynthesis
VERINVLHVLDKLSFGGATKHGVTQLLLWWFPEFDKEKYNVTFVSFRGKDKAGEELESLGAKVYYLNRNKFDPRILRDLLKIMRAEGSQVLHLHGYGASNFGRLASSITKIPAIVHEHFVDLNMPSYQRIADRLLRGLSAHAIVVSNSVGDFMVNDRSFPKEKVETVYSGPPVRIQAVNPEGESAWQAKWNIPAEDRIVATVSRLHPIKGITYFLQSARLILDECPDVTFIIVGDGEIMPDLQKEASDLGIAEKVVFTGFIDDVPTLLSKADVMVISSMTEGVPLTLFEAMAVGCPVVSTDVGGIKEVLEDGKTGFLVQPKDPSALAEKTILLLKNPPMHSEMSDAARSASSLYSVTRNVKHFERLYEDFSKRQALGE